jgi:transposase
LHRIGGDKSEWLDIMRAQFGVLVTRHPKYANFQGADWTLANCSALVAG